MKHDRIVKRFLEVRAKTKITLNKSKSVTSIPRCVLGYHVGGGIIKPDLERLHPLKKLPPPENLKSVKGNVSVLCEMDTSFFL